MTFKIITTRESGWHEGKWASHNCLNIESRSGLKRFGCTPYLHILKGNTKYVSWLSSVSD
jgi:hypothetical protein